MNKFAQISALAATAGLATASSLDMDRSYAAELRSDAGAFSVLNSRAANLQVTAGARFGYGMNFRDNNALPNDDETTIGFGFQDVEVRLTGQVTDSITATVSFDFGPSDSFGGEFFGGDSDSSVELEDAYADWAVNDTFTLRIGQFVAAYSAGRSVNEYHMMGAFRSNAQTLLGDTGWSQGIEAHFGGDNWGAVIGFTDGPFTSNTAFNSAAEADWAFNGRFDFYSDSDKARFNDRAAWRGQSAGWRIGAGGYWANYGDTNPSGPEDEFFGLTVDAAYEGDGWGVNGAFFWQNGDFDGGGSIDNYGFEIGANMFFSDQLEGFARWDAIFFDSDFIDEDFHFISAGINYYFVPESHAAKFTVDVVYSFTDTDTLDALNPSPGGFNGPSTTGLLGASDGEFLLRAQMTQIGRAHV